MLCRWIWECFDKRLHPASLSRVDVRPAPAGLVRPALRMDLPLRRCPARNRQGLCARPAHGLDPGHERVWFHLREPSLSRHLLNSNAAIVDALCQA
jgi:hypothetical protein